MADLLSIGRTGLNAAKQSLETTGHNISNANTEGYSRQRVVQTTSSPQSKNGIIQGTGVRIVRVDRLEAPLVEKRLEAAISENHFFKERVNQLSQVEEIFNEINAKGLGTVLNKFFNSFRELANQPENETIRSVVRDNAKLVVKDFKRIRNTLDNIARSIDKKIYAEVENVNLHLRQVAKINNKIASLEANGQSTGDLRDKRENILRTLSESFKLTCYTDDRNNFHITANGVGTLVSAAVTQELMAKGQSKDDSSNNMSGGFELFFRSRPNMNISSKVTQGRLASLFKTRNEEIKQLQDSIDTIAYNFINSVNSIHRQGFVGREVSIDQNGNPSKSDARGRLTGINFFKEASSIENAASMIDLSNEVKSDLRNISTALAPNSPGDNRVALAISKIQHQKIMKEGTTTLEEELLSSIGRIGLQTGKATLDAEQSEGLVVQAKTARERITGVSVDEEAANMVRYQQAFEASAKMLQTADEMMKVVLDLKR